MWLAEVQIWISLNVYAELEEKDEDEEEKEEEWLEAKGEE